MIFLLPLFFLSACAFKESAPPPLQAPPRAESITISWEGMTIRRTLTRSKEDFVTTAPITLSSPVPWFLAVESTLPLTGSVYVDSVTSRRGDQVFRLSSSIKDGKLEVGGLRGVLSDDRDQRLELFLEGRDSVSGASPWRIRITLLTLPTVPEITPVALENFSGIRKLESPNFRVDLLRALKIENKKDLPIEVTFTGRWLQADLKRKFRVHEVHRISDCETRSGWREYSESYDASFAIAPIDGKFRENWLAILFDKGRKVVLQPKETLMLGLFGSGTTISSFVDQGIPVQRPETVEVPSSCDMDCRGRDLLKTLHPLCFRVVNRRRVGSGVEGGPVEFSFRDGSNRAELRYGSLNAEELVIARSFDFLSGSQPLFQ